MIVPLAVQSDRSATAVEWISHVKERRKRGTAKSDGKEEERSRRSRLGNLLDRIQLNPDCPRILIITKVDDHLRSGLFGFSITFGFNLQSIHRAVEFGL